MLPFRTTALACFGVLFGFTPVQAGVLLTYDSGASATVTFNFSPPESGNQPVQLSVTNTSASGVGKGSAGAALTGFGFDLPDSVSFAADSYDDPLETNSLFSHAGTDITLEPSGSVDLAFATRAFGNGKFGGSNPNDGLAAGDTVELDFALVTQLTPSELEHAFTASSLDAVARFQGGVGAGKVTGEFSSVDNDGDPTLPAQASLPEPASLVVWGLGLIGGGGILRRRKKQSLAAAAAA